MKILVINCGSSSIKYRVFLANGLEEPQSLAGETISCLGSPDAVLEYQSPKHKFSTVLNRPDHRQGLKAIMNMLTNSKYGFHGTSCCYVASRAAELAGQKLSQTKLVICHIGNGVTVAAVQNGRSVDTSMGMTPLEGAMMGTRCGNLDPGVMLYLQRKWDQPGGLRGRHRGELAFNQEDDPEGHGVSGVRLRLDSQ
ncbi:MAG: hypothetical protein K8S13_12145 [Desulfobacula sp.]|uniref:hypothetical protein n=1 Tax=Desulfobacula sp. TaxID=2593537 RepID=UPI0025BA9D56|nr:hypothetical protein [Desulfobacula sp.]MCD4720591.1 hypothetical protein [Desulfobacula sp.]